MVGVYLGGILGPFGGSMVIPMLPEIAHDLDITIEASALTISVYMVTFAAGMTVSGSLAERLGYRRVIVAGFLAYALGGLACAAAPDLGWLIAARAGQGLANAFTSPVLLAVITSATPADALGSVLGRFGSMQAAGQFLAPVVGGAAAVVSWRWGFVVAAMFALVLSSLMPPVRRAKTEPKGRVLALANMRLLRAGGIALGAHLTATGVMTLAAVHASAQFGLEGHLRGAVVAAFGVAGLVAGSPLGKWSDTRSTRQFGIAAAAVLAAASFSAGIAPTPVALALCVALAGAATTAARVAVTTLAARSTPENRGGAMSMALSAQFLGGAIAPAVLLPIYATSELTGFVVAAVGALGAVLLLAGYRPGPSPQGAT